MIDPVVFAEEISFLEDWTGRKLSPSVQARYADFLSQHLDTEQFREAVRLIFEQNKSFPFPSVHEFLEKIHQSRELRAQHEWNRIITFPYNSYEQAYPPGLTPIGYEALKTIKGMHVVHTAPTSELHRLRTGFIHAYTAIAQNPENYDLQSPPEAICPSQEESMFLNPHQPISDAQQALNMRQIQMLRQRLQAQVESPIDPN